MKFVMRVLLVLVLLVALLPASTAQAAPPSPPPADPMCATVAGALGATFESIVLDGAVTCAMYPPSAQWNGDIVLFAHGYVDARQPVGIPWSQIISDQANLPGLLLGLGYAFGTTSYSTNGLAVKEGVADIVKLAKHVSIGKNRADRVFLTGASEGGLVTALALEKYPKQFAGGLSTCGPVGSFVDQVQYWGDFRVMFDQFFPYVLAAPYDPVNGVFPFGPSTPVAIDPYVVANWETIDATWVRPWLASSPGAVSDLLLTTHVPFDSPATAGESILGLLYYNVEATNNGRMVLNPAVAADPSLLLPPSLAGNPYENLAYVKPYYPEGLQRDPVALAEILAHYETSAALQRQLVLMHTTGDPIIPFWQPLGYLQKASEAGTLSNTAFIPVDRYGHCSFTAPEIVFGFYVMVIRSSLAPFSAAQIKAALPEAAQQAEFRRLQEKHPDSAR